MMAVCIKLALGLARGHMPAVNSGGHLVSAALCVGGRSSSVFSEVIWGSCIALYGCIVSVGHG